MFENSQRLSSRSSDFSKPDSHPSASSRASPSSSLRPLREGEFDKEHDAGTKSVESSKVKSDLNSFAPPSSTLKEGDSVKVHSSSFRSSTTLNSPSSKPITETVRTDVNCLATPTVDRTGKPVIETITKTAREINGEPMPTETIRSQIPVEEIPSLQLGSEQPFLPSRRPDRASQFQIEGAESPSPSLEYSSAQPRQRHFSLQDAASTAFESGAKMVDQAKEWVHENAPKVKDELRKPNAAKSWAYRQWNNLKESAGRINTRKLKSYLPRKELLPLLGSVLLAIILGSYLYRNAGRLGLTQHEPEALVPLPELLVPKPSQQHSTSTDHFTEYPHNRDYYQHEHIPKRLSELEEKLAETAKSGLDSASSSLHSVGSKSSQAASHAKESFDQKVENAAEYIQEKVNNLGGKLKDKAKEAKEQLSGYAERVQQQAKKVEAEAEARSKEWLEKGKDRGSESHSHSHFRSSSSPSVSGEGPYDEPNTPQHRHTYEHTLRGAAEYLKDTVGEGMHSVEKRNERAVPQPEPF